MVKQVKVGIVVGGAGNIGQDISRALLESGSSPIAVSRSIENLNRLQQSLGESIAVRQADFTREDEVQECFEYVQSTFGNIDFLVFAPGLVPDPDVPLAQYSTDDWYNTFNTYVTGFLISFREVMARCSSGAHIVAISSAVTRIPGNNLPPHFYVGHYSAAKSALDELCKWGRREAHERGILLSRIAPGAVDVPFHRNAPPHRRPPAMLPIAEITNRVLQALLECIEIDEQVVATPR